MSKIIGRNFDDNDSDEIITADIESMRMLMEKYSNIEHVLENAALTAGLLQYIFNKSQDINAILFYFVIRKYEKLNETKNTVRNYSHIHMEIHSIFVHQKSILHVPINDLQLIQELDDSINVKTYTTIFDKTGKYLLGNVIMQYFEKFRKNITLGMESYCYDSKIHCDMDRFIELKILANLHETIRNCLVRNQKVRCLPYQTNDSKHVGRFGDFQIKAIFLSLNTQYEYFLKSKKYSYLPKTPQNVTMGKTLLSCPPQISLKKCRNKSHYLTESMPSTITNCTVCGIILWGSFPQGWMCSNCGEAVHKDCKDAIGVCNSKRSKSLSSSCQTNTLKNESFNETSSNLSYEIEEGEIGEKSCHNINMQRHFSDCKQNSKSDIITDSNFVNEIKSSYSKSTIKPLKKLQELCSSSYIKDEKSKKPSISHTKSMNCSNSPIKIETDITRSKSARTPSPEIFNFNSSPNRLSNKTKKSENDDNSSVNIEPLIPCDWNLDDEMKISETFEPEIELTQFPNYPRKTSSKNNSEYSRLLVLMEFHHKTKFILMVLKRFLYLLVQRWQKMVEFLDLFESLGLNCIEELYILIRSLVETMNKCKRDDTYKGCIAQDVYKWLTDNNDKNLHCWLRLSVDLCCSNFLQSNKASLMESKRIHPKLNELLSVEYNRLILVEQLANMRPLLFNLPMIVSKIVKDLKRFSKFKEEALIWESVQLKLRYLPKYIDERCMPVVNLINNGTLISSGLRYRVIGKETENDIKLEKFIANFPRTTFKESFVDFQFIVISNLRELHLDDKAMQSSVYIREEVEAAAICYENQMIILQKDNDKYLLKKFKSINQKKLFPIISFGKVHVTKQTVKEIKHHSYELTILLINQAILVQIIFKDEKIRDMWFDHIVGKTKKSLTSQQSISSIDKEKVLSTYSANTLTVKSVLSNLKNVSQEFNKTLNIISKDVLKETEEEENLTKNEEREPNNPHEFIYNYFRLLQSFTNVGVQMIEESQIIEPTFLLHGEVICSKMDEIKNITSNMKQLTQFQNQSDTILLEKLIQKKSASKTFANIQEYIEDIISDAQNKIIRESKTNNDLHSKLTRQNAESKSEK